MKGGDTIPVSKAQQKATAKYHKENYDQLRVIVKKGKKETIQSFAAAQGKSLNAFVNESIDEKMKRDAKKASD